MSGQRVLSESARREAYDLFYLQKMKTEEIAAKYGVHPITIRKVLKEEGVRRGLIADKQLKERLKMLTARWLEEHDRLATRLQEKLTEVKTKLDEIDQKLNESGLPGEETLKLLQMRTIYSREENDLIYRIGDNHNQFFKLVKPMGMLELEKEAKTPESRRTTILNLFIKDSSGGKELEAAILDKEKEIKDYESGRNSTPRALPEPARQGNST